MRPKRSDVLIWVCISIFIVLFPHTGLFPAFTYSIPVLMVIWYSLRRCGESFGAIGFRWKSFSLQAAWVGVLAGGMLFAFMHYIFFPALSLIIHLEAADLTDFASIRGNLVMYIFIVLMGWIVGGLYEEIAFHGFIFTRIEKINNSRYATAIAFVTTTLVFGLYHFQLGTSGVINALVAGAGYHMLMLRFKRNLWYAFFAHGTFDTIAITMIYLGYW